MASAGVVGYSEVIVPNSATTGRGWTSGGPAMWSLVWVGAAVLVLMFLHLALIGRARR